MNNIIVPPSSKSYCNRYLISAFIRGIKTEIKNFNFCDDTFATLNALKELGGIFRINKTSVLFIKREKPKDNIIIDAENSASTLRMIFPLAISLCKHVTFVGTEQLFSRPLEIYINILKEQQIRFEITDTSLEVFGQLPLKNFDIKANISSQFVSGLLFLMAETGSNHKISLTTNAISQPYISMSLKVLEEFGYSFSFENNSYQLINNQPKSPEKVWVEGDMSSLPFLTLLGAFRQGVSIKGVPSQTLQGDSSYISLLSNIGCKMKFQDDILIIESSKLEPFAFDISNCIDLGPILFATAALIPGTSKITGFENLVVKESNRLIAMLSQLNSLGVPTSIENDVLSITGPINTKKCFSIKSYKDHRVAMALIALSICAGLKYKIDDASCINKSYPNFLKDIEAFK